MGEMKRQITLRWFQRRFGTETACRDYLFRLRWPDGFVCPVCANKSCYDLPKRHLFQCTACSRQTSITAGTVMHRTRTPLRVWFWAMYLMSNDKRGLSALQLSKKLAVSYYVAWTMLHKIRRAMKERDSCYELTGLVAAVVSDFGRGPGGDKRGRGGKKTGVLVQASMIGDSVGFARMEALSPQSPDCGRNMKPENCDGLGGNKGSGAAQCHEPNRKDLRRSWQDRSTDDGERALSRWMRIIASNANSFLLGTFHGVGPKHLQKYLDEFCYRFNRRRYEDKVFERLIIACLASSGLTYSELTK